MFSSKSNEWSTPQDLYDELNSVFHFTLDPCSTNENAKCKKHYTIADNGLIQDWSKDIAFVNPPYGSELKNWVKKCSEEYIKGGTCVLLIPARTDTKYQHEYIFNYAKGICFIKGRLKFGEQTNSAPFPSQIVIFKFNITKEQEDLLSKYGKFVYLN